MTTRTETVFRPRAGAGAVARLASSVPGASTDVRGRRITDAVPVPRVRPAWERRYARMVVAADALLLCAASAAALVLSRGIPVASDYQRAELWWLAVGVAGALVTLTAAGAHSSRILGQGPDEYKRVMGGCWRFSALLAVAAYLTALRPARGYTLIALTLSVGFLLTGRYLMRQVVWRQRATGASMHRLVVVGPASLVREVIRSVNERHDSGFTVVGACVSADERDIELGVPILGDLSGVIPAIHVSEADTVAVAGGAGTTTEFVRRLAWQLEGSAIDLMVAPAITDVAGPRIHVRPLANLSMLYVEQPRFGGFARLVKGTFDRTAAALMLVLLSPLLLTLSVAIKLTSGGPVFYRQRRLGVAGAHFSVWKFRSMVTGADALTESLRHLNEADGRLFKIKNDPRVTALGKLLRRYSLDELPQLINVVLGQMSLVGPRPLPEDLDDFAHEERRRLLVKPGITGLWQVSGRSDLNWEEANRLDLYYVENWTFGLDFLILARTVSVVLRRQGAY